jgi:membrane associated rhomboid family serine protease
MLLLPIDRPFDWRRPPVVTLLLLAVNVIVYLGWQLDDPAEMLAARDHYYDSGLAAIELPRYARWLRANGEADFVEAHRERIDDPASPWLGRLLADAAFRERLRGGHIVTAEDAVHDRWQRLRGDFERRLAASTVWGHGLRPAEVELPDLATHMFLHGGPAHLLGNMIFLLALGLLIEAALGSLVLAGLYGLAGLGAAGLFIAAHGDSAAPLVGASGAIAGLMGLCGVLYGRRPIRFFYFVGVYFDYVRAPALVLLALWLGKEIAQLLTFSDVSNVAYVAHIGGLATGAVAGTALRFATGLVDEDALDEPRRVEAFEARLGEAYEHLAALEPERARPLFEQLDREFPNDPRVLDGLFRAARFNPGSESYHDTVRRILALEATDDVAPMMLEALRDYRARARPRARLPGRALARAIELLLAHGTPGEAEPLVRLALRHPEHFEHIGDQALRLAHRLAAAGERGRARDLLLETKRRLPDGHAARRAERALAEIRS